MVYVLNIDGQPLMPTERYGKVYRLLNNNTAKVVRRCPFTIQLLYKSMNNTQEVSLGVDAGSKHVGVSATTQKKELYAAEVELRTDVVKLLNTRREMRRARRSRKTRYRKPRFLNRVHSKQKGWRSPSIMQKVNSHIKVIEAVCKILPITKIRIETAEFDIHKIKNPDVEGIEYQHGEKYGFVNTRNYILFRDKHICRCCGEKQGVLYVTSVDGRKTTAPEDLITVCKVCMEKHLESKEAFNPRKRYFAPPTEMGIIRDILMLKAKETCGIPVEQTAGYITKGIREECGIEKSHINDARCISGNPLATPLKHYYFQKSVRRHNRQIYKMTINKGGSRKLNQAPKYVFGYRLFDKVKYKNRECFIFGRRSSGSFDIRTLNGTKLSAGVTYKKLKLLETRKTILTERRKVLLP